MIAKDNVTESWRNGDLLVDSVGQRDKIEVPFSPCENGTFVV